MILNCGIEALDGVSWISVIGFSVDEHMAASVNFIRQIEPGTCQNVVLLMRIPDRPGRVSGYATAALASTFILVMLVMASCGQAGDPPEVASTPAPTPAEATVETPTPVVSPTSDAPPRPTTVPTIPATFTPVPEPTVVTVPSPAVPRGLPHELPERDLYALAERLGGAPKGSPRTLEVVRTDHQVGHRHPFFVTDIGTDTTHVIDATLQVVSHNAYWYVDDRLNLQTEDLQFAADEYESNIRPTLLEAFGDVWNPGVDGDPRLTVLHANLGGGAAGYFSSLNEFPRHTHPHSNEREMLFMDGSDFRPGSEGYLKVLAHELQHAIHWAHDPGEDSWVNEGLSEVATELVGYSPSFIEAFLSRPQTQLTFWVEGRDSIPHYGAATLFMMYLLEHYGDSQSLRSLIANPADGVGGIESFLQPHGTTFDEVYADWIAANYLDSDMGPYGYANREVEVRRIDAIRETGGTTGHLAPYSSRYFDLGSLTGDLVIEFQGDATTRQVATRCHSGVRCWWGNRGDSIDTTLTHEFDLRNLSEATLEFRVWFDIEEGWDFAYVEVSTDEGETWTILEGEHTTDENPVGNSYGHGYTGASNGWLEERIDLTPFVGSEVLIRFEYITDDAVYEDGFVIDDIAIPQLEFSYDAEVDGGWDAEGFERIDNVVPVDYVVLVMERHRNGADIVRRMEIDEGRQGAIAVHGLGDEILEAAVVVSPLARNTHHLSRFTVEVREDS